MRWFGAGFVRPASALLVVALCACRDARHTTQAIASRATMCSTEAWSAPQPLHTEDGDVAYVGYPRAVRTRQGTAVLGSEAVVWRFADTTYDIVAGWPRGPALSGFFVQPDGR